MILYPNNIHFLKEKRKKRELPETPLICDGGVFGRNGGTALIRRYSFKRRVSSWREESVCPFFLN